MRTSRWILLTGGVCLALVLWGVGGLAVADSGTATVENGTDDRPIEEPTGFQGVAMDGDAVDGMDSEEAPLERVVRLEPLGENVTAESLQRHASDQQSALEAFANETDGLTVKRTFWLSNAVLVSAANEDILDAVLNLSAVEEYHENHHIALPTTGASTAATHPASPPIGDRSTGPSIGDRSTGPSIGDRSTGPSIGDRSTGPTFDARSTGPTFDARSTGPSIGDRSTGPTFDARSTGPTFDARSTDPTFGTQTVTDTAIFHPDATYGLEQIRTLAAWDQYETRGAGTSVAVLDTGVDASHPDIDLAEWAEFDEDGNQVDTDPQDYDGNGHGTHVSGTVAGGNESGTHIGVAPETSLLHGAVLTDCNGGCTGTFSQILGGMEWAVEEGATVASLSLGAEGYFNDFVEPVRNAEAAGTAVVAAIGNDGENTSSSPGNVYNATSVGASDEDRDIATFSSGEEIDTLAAWGTDPNTLDWPDTYVVPSVAAPGVAVESAQAGGGYTTKGGTSMATPHVSGAIALAVSALPDERTPDEIEATLEATARKPDDWNESDAERDTRYGSGIIDVPDAITALGPAATFTVDPSEPLIDSEATFDGSESIGDMEAYEWDFTGDGGTDATGEVVSHTFTDAGETPVTLTVTGADGDTATVTADVRVRLPPVSGDSSPRDLDGDGLYEDIRGSESFDIFDVQTLFSNLDRDPVQNYARYYNFQGHEEDEVTIFDVQSLFKRL